MTSSPEPREMVIITGASTGIGAATAHELAGRGYHVLAGVRRDRDADAIRTEHVEPVILDITVSEHIAALVARVQSDPLSRPVRALVNNAAVPVNAPVETFPLDEWRRTFDVNLFGHIAVIQAMLPVLIRDKGRVVNLSSVGGRIAMATYAPYAATKFAIEAVSDSLRRELALSGVQVVVVEPGAIRTGMADRSIAAAHDLLVKMTVEQQARYDALVRAVTAQAAAATKAGLPATAAAKVIATAVMAKRPRTRYAVGRDAASVALMARILPDWALDRIFAAALRRHIAPA